MSEGNPLADWLRELMAPHGMIVVNGVRVPVTGLALRGGQLELTGRLPGPQPAAEGPVTVFGADGRGVAQGGHIAWKEVGPSDVLEVSVGMRMMTVDEEGSDGKAG